jgi:hypothetical protein
MHNLGAGAVIFTREAARHVLNSFRTHWWADNVRLFAQISGIDLRTYAAFRGNEQWVTTDWGFDAQLARHGLASLALTPARCRMIGQNPPLEQQGLELVPWADACRNGLLPNANNDPAFDLYRDNLATIRAKRSRLDAPGRIARHGGGMLFFAHQLGTIAGGPTWQGKSELIWSQGFGPFAYRAGPGGMSLAVRLSGSCSFLVTGGNTGGKVIVEDLRSGFRIGPELPAESPIIEVVVPGSPVPRELKVSFDEGTVFSGIQTVEPQMLDTTFRFDWHQLPEAVA